MTSLSPNLEEGGTAERARSVAARMTNASEGHVGYALRLQREAPESFRQVWSGQTSMPAALRDFGRQRSGNGLASWGGRFPQSRPVGGCLIRRYHPEAPWQVPLPHGHGHACHVVVERGDWFQNPRWRSACCRGLNPGKSA